MSPVATAELRISEQLQLPVDAMTEAIALLSTRGRGKTHTATVIAEEVLKLQHQVVIVDPVGLYWGLRSSADGKSEGYRILVLGGSHGDLPLQASDAETIARFVVEEELSVVLDLSALPTKSEQVRFCETFFDRLWHLKQAHRSPLLLVLEESQEFAPQRPQLARDLHIHPAAVRAVLQAAGHELRERYRKRGWLPPKTYHQVRRRKAGKQQKATAIAYAQARRAAEGLA